MLLFVKQAGDVRGAKLVGLRLNAASWGRRISPGQDTAVGEARSGSPDWPPPAGVKVAKALQRRQQDGVPVRAPPVTAGAGLGESQIGFQGPMGVRRWWLRSLAKQRQNPCRRSGACDPEARLYGPDPPCCPGMIGVLGGQGGQGGAGIPLPADPPSRRGEVQGALGPEAIRGGLPDPPRPDAGPRRGPPCRHR